MSCIRFVLLSLLLVGTLAQEQYDSTADFGTLLNQAVNFVDQCGERGLSDCIKERAVRYLDTCSGNIEITEGITLAQTTNPAEKEDVAQVPEKTVEARANDNNLDNMLINRLAKFLSSHTLEFKMPKSTVAELRSMDAEEGRKKKKNKHSKLLMPILLLLKMKALILLPLLLKGIALIAIKALLIGKVALLISGFIAIKKLLASKHSQQSYEVVAHPHYSHSHLTSVGDEHHGHIKRSIADDDQYLPYRAHFNK